MSLSAPQGRQAIAAGGPDLKWICRLAEAIASFFSTTFIYQVSPPTVLVTFIGQALRARETADCFRGCFEHAWSAVALFQRDSSQERRGDVVIRNWLVGYAEGAWTHYTSKVKAQVCEINSTVCFAIMSNTADAGVLQVAEAEAFRRRKREKYQQRMRDLDKQMFGFGGPPAEDSASDSDDEDKYQLVVIPKQEKQLVKQAREAALQLYPNTVEERTTNRRHKRDMTSFRDGKEAAKKRRLKGELAALSAG